MKCTGVDGLWVIAGRLRRRSIVRVVRDVDLAQCCRADWFLRLGRIRGAAFTKGTCREIHFRLYRNGRRAARWQPGACTSHPMRERRLSRRLCRPGWRGRRRPAWRHGNNQSSPPRDARRWTARQHRDKGDRTRLRVRERSKGLPLTVLNQRMRRSVPDRSKAGQPCYRMAASGANLMLRV